MQLFQARTRTELGPAWLIVKGFEKIWGGEELGTPISHVQPPHTHTHTHTHARTQTHTHTHTNPHAHAHAHTQPLPILRPMTTSFS